MFLEGTATLSAALVVLQNVIYESEVTAGIVYVDVNRLVLDMQSGALLVVAPVLYPKFREVEMLDETERGGGGFGSTGR